MTIKLGPRLALFVNAAAGEEHLEVMRRFLRGIDTLLQGAVVSASVTAPPGSPADGDAYIVPANASGDWSGHANQIARWSVDLATPAWEFFIPKDGFSIKILGGARMLFDGSAWAAASSGGGSDLPADPRVLTASDTLLATDGSGGIRMNVGSANTLTVPTDSVAIPIKTTIPITQQGSGKTTVVATNGVTIHTAAPLTLGLRAQWSQAALTKIAANEWILTGDLA